MKIGRKAAHSLSFYFPAWATHHRTPSQTPSHLISAWVEVLRRAGVARVVYSRHNSSLPTQRLVAAISLDFAIAGTILSAKSKKRSRALADWVVLSDVCFLMA
jgi:hypothetical protein